jgi:hypothetical protein
MAEPLVFASGTEAIPECKQLAKHELDKVSFTRTWLNPHHRLSWEKCIIFLWCQESIPVRTGEQPMFSSSRPWLVFAIATFALNTFEPRLVAQDRGISISVFPSLAPNVYGSLSYPAWENNAIAGLMTGSSTSGDPTLPSFYQQIANGANIPIWIASEFPSWLLQANPGTVFGPAYAGELGNRLYFNLHVVGNGQLFSISQLSFQATSTDAGNFLGFNVNAGNYNYNSGYVGLNYGPDGIKGTGDDILITSGPNTQLINELFARGSGNAPGVMNSDPGVTNQDKIDNALANIPSNFIFNGTYTLSTDGGDVNGSAFVVVGVPEPTTIALSGLGGSALAFVCVSQWKKRRRRKQRTSCKQMPLKR